ncbi:hypothetical protein ACIRU8_10340 [Streptomyces sp. NPDC101175]|uniref:hypothetical protein n=1 Tax=Streptomyces sp. NPDC101175 TaxID=3366123 RepID=UPI0038365BA9
MDASPIRLAEYLAKAHHLGFSDEVATAELRAVQREVEMTGTLTDVYKTAWSRLLSGPGERPTEKLRDVARRMQAECGWSVHPDVVDQVARDVGQLLIDGAPRTLADEMTNPATPELWTL